MAKPILQEDLRPLFSQYLTRSWRPLFRDILVFRPDLQGQSSNSKFQSGRGSG